MKKLLSIFAFSIVLSTGFVFADTWDVPVELFNNNGCVIMRTNEYQVLTGFDGAVEFDGLTWNYYIAGCSSFWNNYPIVVDTNSNQVMDPCQLEWWPNSADTVCRTKDSLMTPLFSSYESLQFVINQHKPRVNVIQWTVFDFFAATPNAKYMYYFGSGGYSFQYDISDPWYANLLATWYVLHTWYTWIISPYVTLPIASSFAPIAIQSTNIATDYYGPTYFFHRIPVIKLPWWTAFKEMLIPEWWHLVSPTSVIYETITRKVIKKKRLTLPRA
jgi:hypothetical protein